MNKNKIALLLGDEMSRVSFQLIQKYIERDIKNKNLDISFDEIDLSAENRLKTNGKIIFDAIDLLNHNKIGIKDAGITVNEQQFNDLCQKLDISNDKKNMHKLAYKSPNGAIRKAIDGNIIRKEIGFKNIIPQSPDWKNNNLEIVTMDLEGFANAKTFNLNNNDNINLKFNNEDIHQLSNENIVSFTTINREYILNWSRNIFNYAIENTKDIYLGLKDTVISGYDGFIKKNIIDLYNKEFKEKFSSNNINLYYGLIDAQAANIISNPPSDAIWMIPDNNSGNKIKQLVEILQKNGLSAYKANVTISRMSAGGGDQYNSFNTELKAGNVSLILNNSEELLNINTNDDACYMLMSNNNIAIKNWVTQCAEEAKQNNLFLIFGVNEKDGEYGKYFANKIQEYMPQDFDDFKIASSYEAGAIMLTNPPENGLYAFTNLDGDIFSDILAGICGSLALISSAIVGTEGVYLYEAPHGTAPDLYKEYIKSNSKNFNPSSLISAFAQAIMTLGYINKSDNTIKYGQDLMNKLLSVVNDYNITADIKNKTNNIKKEKILNLDSFLEIIFN